MRLSSGRRVCGRDDERLARRDDRLVAVAVLLAVKAKQLEQVRDGEWTEDEPEETEVPHAGECADERDHRMDVRHFLVDDRTNEIVEVSRDPSADCRE